jgi:sugar phosphate isomerase/epimerase
LLDELKSPALKIVLDAANLLQPRNLIEQPRILSDAFDLLGGDIVLAHAKDFGTAPSWRPVAAGQGVVDFGLFLSLLAKAGFKGPLVLHGLTEDEVPAAVAFLKQHLNRLPGNTIERSNAILQPRQS